MSGLKFIHGLGCRAIPLTVWRTGEGTILCERLLNLRHALDCGRLLSPYTSRGGVLCGFAAMRV